MKKWVKYLLTTVLLLAMITPLSVSAAGSGEAEFSDSDSSSTTLTLTVEDSIAQDMTSLRLQLLVEVTDGAMVPIAENSGSKFTFSPAITSDVQKWAVDNTNGKYVINIIISGTESIFENGKSIPASGEHQVAKKKIEIGTLTLSPMERNAFSATVSLMPKEDPDAPASAADGSEIIVEGDKEFDPTPVLEYVEDNGIQVDELRMTNANTVTLSGGEVITEPDPEAESQRQSELESERQSEAESQRQSELESERQSEAESQRQSELESERQSQTQPGTEKQPETQAQPGTEKQPETQAQPGTEKQPETQAQPGTEKQPETQAQLGTEKQPETQPQPGTEKQPETQPQPGTEKQPETQAQPGTGTGGSETTPPGTGTETPDPTPGTGTGGSETTTPETGTEEPGAGTETPEATPGTGTETPETPQPETGTNTPETQPQSETQQPGTEPQSEPQSELQSESETELESGTETELESESEPESESESELTSEEPEQTEPGADQPQEGPVQPGTEDSGDNARPEEEENPPAVNPPVVVSPEETVPFDEKTAPKLQLSSPLAGSSRVRFEWNKVKGADGYEILQVKANGETKLIAEVMAADGTTYEKDLSYDKKYKFRIRAFKLDAKNEKTYGKNGAVKNIRTPEKELGKPGSVNVHADPGSKEITITWKTVKNADGYQIFMRTGEDGAFELVQTINDGKATTCTVTKKYAETYTIRVAAFQSGKKGTPAVFGNYSSEKNVTTAPAKVGSTVLKSKKKGQAHITWTKVSRAEGYQIYRSTSENGKYTRIKNITKKGKAAYTDKTAKSGKTYYYKVRAYVTAADGKSVFGDYSAPKAVKVK